MSTFQHTVQSLQRTRMILVATAVLAALALTIVLVASGTGASRVPQIHSPAAHPSQAELQSQLRAAAGPHYQAPREAR